MISLLAAAAFSQSASAVPVWTLDDVSNFRNGSWSFGDIFTVGSSDLSVTALGAFDANLDGFASNGGIQVGIFRESDNALLTSTFVQSGDTLLGNYRFGSIAELILSANTQYRVVAVNALDLYNIATGSPDNVFSGLTWNGYGYCNVDGTDTLTTCNQFSGTERTWMANFDANIAVPEPGTLALLGIGLFGMGLARRRRKA